MSRSSLAAALCAVLTVGGIVAAPAARAGAAGEAERSPQSLALEGLDRLMQALGLFIDSIPQYEAPVLNEDGDIIIRRKRDHGAAPARPEPPEPLPGDTDSTRI